MSLDKINIVKFITFDGKIYRFSSDTISKWQDCYVKSLADNYMNDGMQVTLDNDCIVLNDHSKYVDKMFMELMYGSKSDISIEDELFDKYCVVRTTIIDFILQIMESKNIIPLNKDRFIDHLTKYINNNKINLTRKYKLLTYSTKIDHMFNGEKLIIGCNLNDSTYICYSQWSGSSYRYNFRYDEDVGPTYFTIGENSPDLPDDKKVIIFETQ